MGSLTNSVFSILLGWVRGMASWLWKTLRGPESSALLAWFGRYWLQLAIALCLLGMLLDLLVHLFRWRPLEVYRSFFRRLRTRRKSQGDTPRQVRRWVYADGSARVEQLDAPAEDAPAEASPVSYTTEDIQVDAQPQVMTPDMPALTPPTYVRRKRSERNRRPASPLQQLFAPDDEDQLISYKPTLPTASKRETFSEPYYPPQWKNPDDKNGPGS